VPRCLGEPATIVMTSPGAQLGTAGDDVIIGTGGDDFIDSLGGHDRICAGGGVDRITADFDPVTGTWDPAIIVIFPPDANPDDDYIDGQDDGDVVAPGAGNDHVWGSDGSDYLTASSATTRSSVETTRTGWTAPRAWTTPTVGGGRTTGSASPTAARP
jgi:Ca2+-binding RTX toxin-like protein